MARSASPLEPIGCFFNAQSGLVVCFAVVVLPVNYIAFDFAVVIPSLHPKAAAILRPIISLAIKNGCFTAFKACAEGLGDSMHLGINNI